MRTLYFNYLYISVEKTEKLQNQLFEQYLFYYFGVFWWKCKCFLVSSTDNLLLDYKENFPEGFEPFNSKFVKVIKVNNYQIL